MITAFDGEKLEGFWIWADIVSPASSLVRI